MLTNFDIRIWTWNNNSLFFFFGQFLVVSKVVTMGIWNYRLIVKRHVIVYVTKFKNQIKCNSSLFHCISSWLRSLYNKNRFRSSVCIEESMPGPNSFLVNRQWPSHRCHCHHSTIATGVWDICTKYDIIKFLWLMINMNQLVKENNIFLGFGDLRTTK